MEITAPDWMEGLALQRARQKGPLFHGTEQIYNPGIDPHKIKLSAKINVIRVDADGQLNENKRSRLLPGKIN